MRRSPNLKLNNEDNDRGTTFIEYSQTIGGVEVFEGIVQVVVNKDGEVLSVREGFLAPAQKIRLRPTLTQTQGIAKAFEHAGRTVIDSFAETGIRAGDNDSATFANPLDPSYEDVISELNVVRINNKARLAWHVYTDVGPNEWYEILLDAHTGELLLRHNLYVFEAQGTVYTEAPDKGARQLVSFVGDTTINTAAGWMGTVDRDHRQQRRSLSRHRRQQRPGRQQRRGTVERSRFSRRTRISPSPSRTTVDPRTQQAAVVTNLFYFNNFIHDFSYASALPRSARNFQMNNYGRGGIGNDSVRAEAQDGSGTNNANFSTPPDGSRPRMQQYLFTSPNPDRDSSMDGDVVFHEYGHGISNRLIGNGSTALSGTQSGAMGEAWSDYWAITHQRRRRGGRIFDRQSQRHSPRALHGSRQPDPRFLRRHRHGRFSGSPRR